MRCGILGQVGVAQDARDEAMETLRHRARQVCECAFVTFLGPEHELLVHDIGRRR